MTIKTMGVVTKWQDDKGFGFIESEQGESVFFHISEFKPPRRPSQGDKVVFELGEDANGRPRAHQVQERDFGQKKTAQDNKRQDNNRQFNSRQDNKRQDNRSQQHKAYDSQQAAFKSSQSNRLFMGIGFYAVLAFIAVTGKLNWLVVGWYILIGVVTFLMYAKDKAAAQKDKWRTPESTLHILSLIGGWVGAMLAQTYLRHKSQKADFRLMYYLTVILNLAGLLFLLAGGDIQRFIS